MSVKSWEADRKNFRKSSLRKWGWPLMTLGAVIGFWGVVMVAGQVGSYRPDADMITMGVLLTALGVTSGNLGFFLLMFGIIEDRTYEAQAIIKNGIVWLGEKIDAPRTTPEAGE